MKKMYGESHSQPSRPAVLNVENFFLKEAMGKLNEQVPKLVRQRDRANALFFEIQGDTYSPNHSNVIAHQVRGGTSVALQMKPLSTRMFNGSAYDEELSFSKVAGRRKRSRDLRSKTECYLHTQPNNKKRRVEVLDDEFKIVNGKVQFQGLTDLNWRPIGQNMPTIGEAMIGSLVLKSIVNDLDHLKRGGGILPLITLFSTLIGVFACYSTHTLVDITDAIKRCCINLQLVVLELKRDYEAKAMVCAQDVAKTVVDYSTVHGQHTYRDVCTFATFQAGSFMTALVKMIFPGQDAELICDSPFFTKTDRLLPLLAAIPVITAFGLNIDVPVLVKWIGATSFGALTALTLIDSMVDFAMHVVPAIYHKDASLLYGGSKDNATSWLEQSTIYTTLCEDPADVFNYVRKLPTYEKPAFEQCMDLFNIFEGMVAEHLAFGVTLYNIAKKNSASVANSISRLRLQLISDMEILRKSASCFMYRVPPVGVLIWGPPGIGKTQFAQKLITEVHQGLEMDTSIYKHMTGKFADAWADQKTIIFDDVGCVPEISPEFIDFFYQTMGSFPHCLPQASLERKGKAWNTVHLAIATSNFTNMGLHQATTDLNAARRRFPFVFEFYRSPEGIRVRIFNRTPVEGTPSEVPQVNPRNRLNSFTESEALEWAGQFLPIEWELHKDYHRRGIYFGQPCDHGHLSELCRMCDATRAPRPNYTNLQGMTLPDINEFFQDFIREGGTRCDILSWLLLIPFLEESFKYLLMWFVDSIFGGLLVSCAVFCAFSVFEDYLYGFKTPLSIIAPMTSHMPIRTILSALIYSSSFNTKLLVHFLFQFFCLLHSEPESILITLQGSMAMRVLNDTIASISVWLIENLELPPDNTVTRYIVTRTYGYALGAQVVTLTDRFMRDAQVLATEHVWSILSPKLLGLGSCVALYGLYKMWYSVRAADCQSVGDATSQEVMDKNLELSNRFTTKFNSVTWSKPSTRPIVAAYKDTKTFNLTSEAKKAIQSKAIDNLVALTINGQNGTGLFCGAFLLTSTHLLTTLDDMTWGISIYGSKIKRSIRVADEQVKRFGDICIINTGVQGHANIVSHIANGEDIPLGTGLLIMTQDEMKFCKFVELPHMIQLEASGCRIFGRGYNVPGLVGGMSGSPVFLVSETKFALVGFHSGVDKTDHAWGIFTPTNYEIINVLKGSGDNVFGAVAAQSAYDAKFCTPHTMQIVDLHPKSMLHHVLNDEHYLNGPITVIGSIKDATHGRKESKVQPTKFYETFSKLLPPMGPPTLNPRVVVENGVEVYVDPYLVNLGRIAQSTKVVNFALLNLAVRKLAEYQSRVGDATTIPGPLTLMQSLIGDHTIYLNPINLKTSVGYPHHGVKKDYVTGIPGEALYLTQPILDDVNFILDQLDAGFSPMPLFTASLKDEPIKQTKNDEGGVRMFMAGQMGLTIVMRAYFGGYFGWLRENRSKLHSKIGVNCASSEWNDMAYHMMGCEQVDGVWIPPKNGVWDVRGGDFKWYDKLMMYSMHGGFVGVECCRNSPNFTPQDIVRMTNLCPCLQYYAVDIKGDLILLSAASASGGVGTTENNCNNESLAESMAYWMSYAEHHNLSPYLGALACEVEFPFYDNVRLCNYGDDNLNSLDRHKIKFITAERTGRMFANMGLVMTNTTKTGPPVYEPITQVTFLKRQFRFEPAVGQYVAPLDVESIYKMLTWRVVGDMDIETHGAVVMNESLNQMWFHGREAYDSYVDMLELALILPKDVKTWDELTILYQNSTPERPFIVYDV